ncbi:MAG: hypothetical protein HY965_03235 [Ignavibacteriales bacterium]|nr:hypothetical protein [Ignavibacteriales bacterium]
MNKDDIVSAFGKSSWKADRIIRDTIYQIIADTAKAYLANVKIALLTTPVDLLDSVIAVTDFDTIDLPLDANKQLLMKNKQLETYPYFIPNREWLLKQGITPDIVFFIQKIYFGEVRNDYYGPRMMIPGQTISTPTGPVNIPPVFRLQSGPTPANTPSSFSLTSPLSSLASSIYGSLVFIIYDYRAEKYISYGTVFIDDTQAFIWSKPDWIKDFGLIAKAILKSTVLTRK